MDEPRAARVDAGPGGAGGAARRASGPLGGGARLALAGDRGAAAGAGRRGARGADRAGGSRSRPTCSAGSTAASGAPTATRPTPPVDQRADDGRSLSFTSEPLPERLELLGNVRVELELESDRPVAQLAARLCDVAPDGTSSLVTRGVLNLTHRDSHEHPSRSSRAAHARDARAGRHRPGGPGGAPVAARALARLLAVAVAGARAGHARHPPAGAPSCCRCASRAPRTPSCALRGARGRRAARGRDPRARRRPAHARARLHRRAHGAHLRLGHRRALPDRPRRPDRGLLGLHDLLDRARRPAVGAGELPHRDRARPGRLGHARGDQRGHGRDAERFRVRTELEAFENGELVRRKEWSFETPRELG